MSSTETVRAADLWYVREKYATGRISFEEFEVEVAVVIQGGRAVVPAGEVQTLPPGPDRLVRRG